MTMATIQVDDAEVLAGGLAFPEGPLLLPDGSVLVTEMHRGTLTRIDADGSADVVAICGGAPNGAALGPDGAVYVCNNGGYREQYQGGSIQRVDLESGAVDTLYRECNGHRLCGPNDLALDREGRLWFTDTGKFRARDRDRGGIYCASATGDSITEVIYPVDAPNGIGLSPDGSTLYYAETLTGRLYARAIVGPAQVEPAAEHDPSKLLCGLAGLQMFDSLAVHPSGDVCVATLFSACVTVVAPSTASVCQVTFPAHLHDPMLTNLCFGGPDHRIAYVTMSETGRLVRCRWPLTSARH